jgi:low temperature requirement protein LtrA
MPAALLRDRRSPAEGRVAFVELFFDLVFVFAVTQLSHALATHLTARGAVEALVLLLAVWSVWVYTTWATSWLDTRHTAVRLLFFFLMAGGLVLSTSLPRAMNDRAPTFALAIALMQNGRNIFTVWAIGSDDVPSRRNFTRIQVWLLLSGGAWVAGAFAPPDARLVWWIGALVLEIGSPWWKYWTPGMGVSTLEDWQVSPQHFAERCGLFVIIALGESVLLTGATFAELRWTTANVAAFATAFAGSVAIWWVYFATTADAASEKFEHSEHTGELARAAYTYAHIPIVGGIILSAVGDEVLLAHPTGHTEPPHAAAILGGPALFLVGSILFNRMMCGTFPRSHLVGFGLLGAAALVSPLATPLALGVAGVVVLAGVGAWETRYGNASRRLRPGGADVMASPVAT